MADPSVAPAGDQSSTQLADPRTAASAENTLQEYLKTGFEKIAGWLWMPAVEATLLLADIQKAKLPASPVCEIGVWEARYLTLLSFLPATPQPVLGIDPFIHGGNRDEQLVRVRSNIRTYARRPDLVSLLQQDSRKVTVDTVLRALGGKCQFVSVDGDHTMEGALHDLRLTEQILAPAGIVAVDDIPNFACPGVTEAVMRHCLDPLATLAPFMLVSNKLFMTQREHCEFYRQAVLERCSSGAAGEWGRNILAHRTRMAALKVPVVFMGQELLVKT
jgi:hypothetical protein